MQSPLPNLRAMQSPLPNLWAMQSPLPNLWAMQSPLRNLWAMQSPLPNLWAMQSPLPNLWAMQSPLRNLWAMQSPLPLGEGQGEGEFNDVQSPPVCRNRSNSAALALRQTHPLHFPCRAPARRQARNLGQC